MSSGDSLELKLGKLMMALRGVDPAQLAAKQQSTAAFVTTAETKKESENVTKNNDDEPHEETKEEEQEEFEILEIGTKNNNKSLDDIISPKKQSQIAVAASESDTTSVELLMKQFVSTLRDDIKSGKQPHHTSQDEEKSTGEKLPDYSAMSMEELLDQIDELVDNTSTTDK